MTVALQLISAFLATLGGLLISADFIGTERLDRAEDSIRQRIRDFAFRAWDYYQSIEGIAVVYWGRIGAGLLVVLIVLLSLVHYFWLALSIPWILVSAVTLCGFAFLFRNQIPGLLFLVGLPFMGGEYLVVSFVETFLIFPTIKIYQWAEHKKIPYLIKLVGASFVVIGFVVYAISYFF